MNKYQKEYIHRINNVIDYIEQNLNGDLSLAVLSDVANFSAYHFHRIFSTFTGETLNGFIKRKRIEKAGSLLLSNPETPINDIAYYCGFNSFSVFCRNFKEHFKMSAQEFRAARETEFSKNSQSNSKIGKLLTSKDDYVCDVESLKTGGYIMDKKFEVKEMPALNLVYYRHVGEFHLIGQAYEKLMKWAGPRGLLSSPDLKTVTVYHDDPSVTEIEKVRQSACITVNGEVKTEGEIGNMSVPSRKYAVGSFEISVTEFKKAWDSMCIWVSESGYQPADGYSYELYHKDPEEHPEKKFVLDICIPVKPM